MSKSFNHNDVILIEKFTKKLERYDVVIINTKEKGLKGSVIKRVIGLPCETIQIINGEVYVNEKKLNDDISREYIEYSGLAKEKIKLDENSIFVLGDNRNNSEDSRHDWLGIVNLNQIEGKAILKIYPFNDISFVK